MNWRDHTNAMTVAERAEEFVLDGAVTLDGWISLITTFGHVCANAELERRRAVEAERDALREELEHISKENVVYFNCDESIVSTARKALGRRDIHGAVDGVERMAEEIAKLAETAARLRAALREAANANDWREDGHPLAAFVVSASVKYGAVRQLDQIPISPAETAAAERLKGGAQKQPGWPSEFGFDGYVVEGAEE